MAKKRLGRGRLSSINLLPPEADKIVAWAAQELRELKRTQADIHFEFNERLYEIDPEIEPISASAFNRHAIRLMQIMRRIEDTREIANVLTERLEPGQTDDLTIMVAETIKTLVFELLNKGGEAGFSPKAAMEMASALKSAAGAQKISADRRLKLEAELATKVDDAVETVAKVAGISHETAEAIKAEILGVNQ